MTSDIYCLLGGRHGVVDLIQTQFSFKELTKQDCTFSLFLFFTCANRSKGGLSALGSSEVRALYMVLTVYKKKVILCILMK